MINLKIEDMTKLLNHFALALKMYVIHSELQMTHKQQNFGQKFSINETMMDIYYL